MGRAFSYDVNLLRRLYEEHGDDWMPYQYAWELTNDMRARHGPHAKSVLPNTVSCYLTRHRHELTTRGIHGRAPSEPRTPWPIPNEYKMDYIPRQLRMLDRLSQGDRSARQRDQEAALRFERKLREGKKIVDRNERGKPYLRKARQTELDDDGQLIDIVARLQPAG